MKKKFGFFKNKRGSGLVEKIMLVAFSVAAGGAIIVYTSNIIIEAENHNVPGLNLTEDGGGNPPQVSPDNRSFTLSADDLRNKTFTNLYNLCNSYSSSTLIGKGNYSSLNLNNLNLYANHQQYQYVHLWFRICGAPRAVGLDGSGKFAYTTDFSVLKYDFSESYTFEINEDYYNTFRAAILADLGY